jgi:RNase adaptor protein for sRNA GlmZ degradation
MSGNGGGYVFDCRSIHNPGRYAPYKKLTGRDEPVIRFLEDDGEVFDFLTHVYGVVDPHVETYASRGFTSLMVSFGCTGGQHRSVYCAEQTARHIVEKYPHVRVRLVHREQNITESFGGDI